MDNESKTEDGVVWVWLDLPAHRKIVAILLLPVGILQFSSVSEVMWVAGFAAGGYFGLVCNWLP